MKREEKNQQTRRKIMDNALLEFSQQGYGRVLSIQSVLHGMFQKGLSTTILRVKTICF